MEHPARAFARKRYAFGGLFAALGLPLLLLTPVAGGPLLALAAWMMWAGWFTQRMVDDVVPLNRAHDMIARGDRGAAEVTLALRRFSSRLGRRLVSTHRAVLALQTGDARMAEAFATRALAVPLGRVARGEEKVHVAWAHSIRALARASLHEHAGALDDANRACAKDAAPATWGNAELARAIVAANEERKADVRVILERGAPFFDDIGGREQQLVRALAKLAREETRSAYRHAAKAEEDKPIDAWRALGVPEPTAFPDAPAMQPAPPKLRVGRFLMRFVAGVAGVLFVGAILVLRPDGSIDIGRFGGALGGLALAVLVLTGLSLVSAGKFRSVRRQATLGALRGDAASLKILSQHRRSPDAWLELARASERACDFEKALEQSDKGLQHANASAALRAAYWDIAIPSLEFERAIALIALRKTNLADTALGSISNPGFAHMAAMMFRARFAQALIRGDRAAALDLARKRGECLPVPQRDMFLIDLLEATEGNGANDEEWSRLHAEYAKNPELAKWVEHFMPGMGSGEYKRRVTVINDEPIADSGSEVPQQKQMTIPLDRKSS